MNTKETFLSVCGDLPGRFTFEHALEAFRERKDSDPSTEYLRSVLLRSSRILKTRDDQFVHRSRLFNDAHFWINPLPNEVSQNYLLLGHRAIPYYNPDLQNRDITLVNDIGEPLDRVEIEIPWHLIKKYNLGAPIEHQVQPENERLEPYFEEFLEHSYRNREFQIPDFDVNRHPENQPSYQLDMKLSDNTLIVKGYRFRISRGTPLLARVKNYDEGVIEVRAESRVEPGNGDPDREMVDALRDTLKNTDLREESVFPVLTRTLARYPKFLDSSWPSHWVKSVLSDDRIQLKNKAFDPKLTPIPRSVNQPEQVLSRFSMNTEFGELLEEYQDRPVDLVDDAFDAKRDGDPKFDGYMWCIHEMGSDCHEPLISYLAEGTENQKSFAAVALEMTWNEDLENRLKVLASDRRLSDEARNMILYLLANHGSDETRNFTNRIARDEGMLQKELTPEEALQRYVHSVEGRAELIYGRDPRNNELIRQLLNVNSPLVAHLGCPLVYSTRKKRREWGRDAIQSSGLPMLKSFLNDLDDSPSEPLRRFAGTPFVEREQAPDAAGELVATYSNPHDLSGEFVIGTGARVDDHFHILLVIINQQKGILDAEYAALQEREQSLPELLSGVIPSWELNLFEVHPRYARDVLIDAEHQALHHVQFLPEHYRLGKLITYLPMADPMETGSFQEFWNRSPEGGDISDRNVHRFCRGDAIEQLSKWVPLCAFNNHEPRQFVSPERPEHLCENFKQQLRNRFKHLGYLLFQNNQEESARIARHIYLGLKHGRKQIVGTMKNALFDNLTDQWDQFNSHE